MKYTIMVLADYGRNLLRNILYYKQSYTLKIHIFSVNNGGLARQVILNERLA